MKAKLFVIALLVAVVSFGSCKKKESKDNTIKSFTVAGVAYTVDNTNGTIVWNYSKPSPGQWLNRPEGWPSVPGSQVSIVLTHDKASHTLNLGGNVNFTNPVTFTVNAQNGDPKTYTVTVTSDQ